jgi:archaellum component FlaC
MNISVPRNYRRDAIEKARSQADEKRREDAAQTDADEKEARLQVIEGQLTKLAKSLSSLEKQVTTIKNLIEEITNAR